MTRFYASKRAEQQRISINVGLCGKIDEPVPPDDSERTRVTHITELGNAPDALPAWGRVHRRHLRPRARRRVQLGTAPFEIGRSSKNDLFIDQESISRHHARITFDGTHYWVADLGSTNGTYVNDESGPRAAPARRRPGPRRPVDPQVHDRREHRGALPRGDLPPDDGGRPHADVQPAVLQRGARARVQPLEALRPRALAHRLRHRPLQGDQRHHGHLAGDSLLRSSPPR